MPDQDYLNGIRVVKGGDDVRIILTPNQAVVGVVGTAPHASDSLLPVETPTAFFKSEEAKAAILPAPSQAATDAERGTLFYSVEAIFNQRAQTVIVVRAKSDSLEDIGKAIECFLESEALTNYKPKILCATGHTANIPVDVPPVNPTPTPEPTPEPTPDNNPNPTPLRSIRHSVPAHMKVR